ncbi:hypothetical protein V5799_026115 [Amblyomma americanum]|uniref:Uncharacterized protein n=1 Tax=Amblyomma americanum TaxID=6943 RepID=A0AAQ4DJH9_AMBAM
MVVGVTRISGTGYPAALSPVLPTAQPYISPVIARAVQRDGSLVLRTRKAWSSVSPGYPAQRQRLTVGYKRRFLPLGPHLAAVTITASIM